MHKKEKGWIYILEKETGHVGEMFSKTWPK